jgi:hypothetical protein
VPRKPNSTVRDFLLILVVTAQSVHPQMPALQTRAWGDEDVEGDLAAVAAVLEAGVTALSSFEALRKEVLGGRLRWGPVHRYGPVLFGYAPPHVSWCLVHLARITLAVR